MSVISAETTGADLAYEVLVRTWRPLPLPRLRASIKALCGIDVSESLLGRDLQEDPRFTVNGGLRAR